jgi:hypothetical protein
MRRISTQTSKHIIKEIEQLNSTEEFIKNNDPHNLLKNIKIHDNHRLWKIII